MNNVDIAPGMVWLVGAGPGDADLLTRKAEKLIHAASIIFYDALVGREILDLAAHNTRLVYVGKRSGRHSKAQPDINNLLVSAALQGEKVVRLKGGDPSIFGRAQEEMQALADHGIAYAICPGVTAASAAAASIGKSLTLRGLARRLTFVTAHVKAGEDLNLNWQALADPQATLVVYMGRSTAHVISRQLQNAGLSGDTPAILVENASLPEERHFSTSLSLLGLTVKTTIGTGPMVLLIGEALGNIEQISNPALSNSLRKVAPVIGNGPECSTGLLG